MPSLIIICGDGRLKERDDFLFDYYWELDGTRPYRMMNAGAGNVLEGEVGDRLLEHSGLFLKTVGHIHIEQHMAVGTIPGCAQYRDTHERYGSDEGHVPGLLYPPSLEEQQHRSTLGASARKIRQYQAESIHRPPSTIAQCLYRFTDRDVNGEAEIIASDRELPGFVSEPSMAGRVQQFRRTGTINN